MIRKFKKGIIDEMKVISILNSWNTITQLHKTNELDKKGIDVKYFYKNIESFGQIKPYSFLKTKVAKDKWKKQIILLIKSDKKYNNTFVIIYTKSTPLRILMIKHWTEI